MSNRYSLFAALLVATLLALMPVGDVFAQDEEAELVVYCGLLSAEDCALLEGSVDAMRMLTSARSETRTELYLVGLDGFAQDSPAFAYIRQSAFMVDPAVIDRIVTLQEMDAETLAAQPDLEMEMALLTLQIDSANVSSVLLSEELAGLIEESIGISLPSDITFETRLVNGVLYIYLADIAEQVPQLGAFGEWIGIDVGAIVTWAAARSDEEEEAAEEIALEEIDLMLPGETLPGAVVIEVEDGTQPFYDDIVEIIALRDSSADEQPVAVHRNKIDVQELLTSPLLTAEILSAIGDTDADAGDPTPFISFGQTLLSILVSDLDVSIRQGIGMEMPYVYGVDSEISWDLGSADSSDPLATRQIVLFTSARTGEMNNVESIPAPEDAFVPPIRLILGLLDTIAQ